MKRTFDILLALPLMVATAPIILCLCVLIRLDSPGPAIFSQERVGRHGKRFACHKLRTMRVGTPSLPTHEMPGNAITRLGRRLRATKLDELPQLWNVIAGQMSLVGPRPCLPSQAALIEHRAKLGVLSLRPGITGLSQVRGIDMSDPERCARTDAEYLGSRSLYLDFVILLRTVSGSR